MTDNSGSAPEVSLPPTRMVCRYVRYGGPEVLEWQEETLRLPRFGEVLVKVKSVSVNPVDWKILDGRMKPITPLGKGPFRPRGFGSDYAGVVAAVGPGVKDFKTGDRVMGMMNPLSSGTWASYLRVPAFWLAAAPVSAASDRALIEAGGLPAVGITALRIVANIPEHKWRGARVLLNGAAGGVGSLTLQILVSLGAEVHAVASESRHAGLISLGARSCSDYRTTKTEELGARFDAVVDAHGSLLYSNPRIFFAPTSKIKLFVPVSIPNNAIPRSLIVGLFRLFAGIKTGAVLAIPSKRLLKRLGGLCDSGQVKALVDRVYPKADFRDAVAQSVAGHGFGKIVVDLDR